MPVGKRKQIAHLIALHSGAVNVNTYLSAAAPVLFMSRTEKRISAAAPVLFVSRTEEYISAVSVVMFLSNGEL